MPTHTAACIIVLYILPPYFPQNATGSTNSTSNDQLLQQKDVEARKKTSPTSLQPSALADNDMPGEAALRVRPRPRGSKDGSNLKLSFSSWQTTSVDTSQLPSPVPRPRRPRVNRSSDTSDVSSASSSTVGETPESPSTFPRQYPNKSADVVSTHKPQMYEGTERRPPTKPRRQKPAANQRRRPASAVFQEGHPLPEPQTSDSYKIVKNDSLDLVKFAGDPELRRRLAEQHEKTVTNIPSSNIQKLEHKKEVQKDS